MRLRIRPPPSTLCDDYSAMNQRRLEFVEFAFHIFLSQNYLFSAPKICKEQNKNDFCLKNTILIGRKNKRKHNESKKHLEWQTNYGKNATK